MIEDKLTPEQRIRLESVAQANVRLASRLGPSAGGVLAMVAITELLREADRVARYVETGEQ